MMIVEFIFSRHAIAHTFTPFQDLKDLVNELEIYGAPLAISRL